MDNFSIVRLLVTIVRLLVTAVRLLVTMVLLKMSLLPIVCKGKRCLVRATPCKSPIATFNPQSRFVVFVKTRVWDFFDERLQL